MRTYFFFCFFFVAIFVANAQPQWEEISPLPGNDVGAITRIITEDSGIWATICDHPGANPYLFFRPYYSSDGGDSWELRDTGIPQENSVIEVLPNPHNPDRLIASVRYGITAPFLSLDRGQTWLQVPDGIEFTHDDGCQAGWFADGIHAWCYVYADLGASYYFYSSDSGGTWSGYSNMGNLVKLMPLDDLDGYIIESQFAGLMMSTDFGATWTYWWDLTFDTYYFGGVGPYGSTPGTIYASAAYVFRNPFRYSEYPIISEDSTHTWRFLNAADTLHWHDLRSCDILVDPLLGGHLYYNTVDTIFESVDNGQSWTAIWYDENRAHFMTIIGYDPYRDWIYASGVYPFSESPLERAFLRWRRGQAVDEHHELINRFSLSTYPNPFNPTTTLAFTLPRASNITLTIFNLLGQSVYETDLGRLEAGEHRQIFDGSGLPSGLYLARIEAAGTSQMRKMMLLK